MQFIFEKMNSYPQMIFVVLVTIVLSLIIFGALIIGYLDHKSDKKLQKNLEDCLKENVEIKNRLYAKEYGKISEIDDIEDTYDINEDYDVDDEGNGEDIYEEQMYDTNMEEDDCNDEYTNL